MSSTKDKIYNFLHAIAELLPPQIFRQLKWNYYKYSNIKKLTHEDKIFGVLTYNFEHITNYKKNLILVIDRNIPSPDEDSGSFRMDQILKILSKKFEVIFLPTDLLYPKKYLKMMQINGIECIKPGNYYDVEEFFRTYGKHFNYVLISRPIVARDYLPVTRKYCVNAKFIYDTVDLHYLRLQRESAFKSGSQKRSIILRANKIKKIEIQNIKSVDQTWVISNDEKDIVSKLTTNVKVIPNIHPVANAVKDFYSTKDILFIGGFRHTPNVDAMLYFVSEIFPEVLKRVNDVKLVIIGSHPPQEILNLKSENIIVKGFVEKLESDLINIRVFVAPLRYGAGMKGKIGLAMSYGIPIVSTTIGTEGFGFSGKELVIEDDPINFAESVANLYNNEKEWNLYQSIGKDFMNRFTPEVVGKKILSLFES